MIKISVVVLFFLLLGIVSCDRPGNVVREDMIESFNYIHQYNINEFYRISNRINSCNPDSIGKTEQDSLLVDLRRTIEEINQLQSKYSSIIDCASTIEEVVEVYFNYLNSLDKISSYSMLIKKEIDARRNYGISKVYCLEDSKIIVKTKMNLIEVIRTSIIGMWVLDC